MGKHENQAQPFANARYGVFFHYLYDSTESFHVPIFVEAVLRTGADYVFFTLGQNSGHYNAPNPVYDHYTGYAPGQMCSARDLPMEIADALAEHGIPLMLYLPSNAPVQDLKAAVGLYGEEPRMVRGDWFCNDVFPNRWSQVMGYWARHYGKRCTPGGLTDFMNGAALGKHRVRCTIMP